MFILIGVVIGIAISAIFVSTRILPFYYRVAEETGQKPFTTLVGDLYVNNLGNKQYIITSKDNPKLGVMWGNLSGGNTLSDISIIDKNQNQFDFIDRDANGVLDGWTFSNEDILCTYGRMSGYPDTVTRDGNKFEPLVRIDGKYFPSQLIDGMNFIEINGELVELEAGKFSYFKIKGSEQ